VGPYEMEHRIVRGIVCCGDAFTCVQAKCRCHGRHTEILSKIMVDSNTKSKKVG